MMWYKASTMFMSTLDGINFTLYDNDSNVMAQTTIADLKNGPVSFYYNWILGGIRLYKNSKVNFALDYQTINGNLVLKSNGTTLGTYNPYNPLGTEINIPVPSNVSELENDSGFITLSAIPSNVSAFNNDVGYLTASDVSTSALYPSSPYSAYVQIDDYGEVYAKKLVNETGVWFVKAIMEQYTTDPVTGYWVSPPKATDDGTNILVEIWVQDIGRVYGPMKVSHLASSSSTEISLPVNYHNVGFRVQLKKSTQSDIPLWIDYGRLVRDGDANTGLRISQIEDDIGLVHDISEKRDLTDISYPASVDSTGMYTISKFTVDGVWYDVFGTGYPSTGNSYWTDDGE